jgi:ATP-dependent 26S proteasome regulatory subunit
MTGNNPNAIISNIVITAISIGAAKFLVDAGIELYSTLTRQRHGPRLMKLLNRMKSQNIKLNQYEELIATEVIFPEDIDATFSDIGGLDSVIGNLRETVLLPLCHAAFFSRHLSPPKGVLLYGPPGCGI